MERSTREKGSFFAACAIALVTPSCGGESQGGAGSAASAPPAPERCYLIAGESDSARLERNESGGYSVIESTFETWNFDAARQEVTLSRGTTGNGRYSLKVLLAPAATVAAARFVECTNMPQQMACYEVTSPVPAVVNGCDGAPVIVDSAAGCYDEYGGGFRVVLRGDPNHYDAVVSERGGSEVEWMTSLGAANSPERSLFVMAPLGGGLTFTIGSTQRIAALATFTPDGPLARRFVVCAGA